MSGMRPRGFEIDGERLRELRKARGIPLPAFAQQVGVAKSSISLIEAGRRRVSLPLLERIAERLGVLASDLTPAVRVRLQPAAEIIGAVRFPVIWEQGAPPSEAEITQLAISAGLVPARENLQMEVSAEPDQRVWRIDWVLR